METFVKCLHWCDNCRVAKDCPDYCPNSVCKHELDYSSKLGKVEHASVG